MHEGTEKAVRLFREEFVLRTRLRAYLALVGVASALFWTLALLAGAWLAELGLGALAAVLLGVWLGVNLPVLLAQATFILEAVRYGVTGQIFLNPMLERLLRRSGEREQRESPPRTAARRIFDAVVLIAAYTSPAALVSFWCFTVIARAPETAYVWRAEPKETASAEQPDLDLPKWAVRRRRSVRSVAREAESRVVDDMLAHV